MTLLLLCLSLKVYLCYVKKYIKTKPLLLYSYSNVRKKNFKENLKQVLFTFCLKLIITRKKKIIINKCYALNLSV